MTFNEKPITLGDCNLELGEPIKGCYLEDWKRLKAGEPKKYIQSYIMDKDVVCQTIVEGYKSKASPMPSWEARWFSNSDLCKVGTFPQDYDFCGIYPAKLIGRSVPPIMMAQISSRVYEQWLSKINNQ